MTWTAWLLIGAALVFFMQCGFAMVETGFTRAKNTGNILFKNFVDFCIGCVCFLFLGFGLMMGVDYVAGFIGVPNLDIFRVPDANLAIALEEIGERISHYADVKRGFAQPSYCGECEYCRTIKQARIRNYNELLEG